MKHIIYLSILTVFLAGCDKQLDLKPEDTLLDREVFNNLNGTEQVMADAYFNLFRASTGSISYLIGDFTTANIKHSVYYDAMDAGNTSPEDPEISAVWSAYYKVINNANNILEKVPQYATYSESLRNQYIAEAKFIRALAYLDLLKLFGDGALTGNMAGLGLPLQLTPFKGYDTGELIPRSPNGDVYAQIIKDLNEAIPGLPDLHGDDLKTRSRGTKGAAYALLTRAYMYMHRYDDAVLASTEVLGRRPATYELSNSLFAVFPNNQDGSAKGFSKEHIFGFPVSHMKSSSTYARNNLGDSYFFKRSFWIDPEFMGMHETNDRRLTHLIFKGDSLANPDQFSARVTFKFNDPYGRDNVTVIRLSEVLLSRCEALAREDGVVPEAVNLLNEVRSRAIPGAIPYTASSFASRERFLEAILKERRLELAFEGHYRYDRIRTGQAPRDNGLPSSKWVLPLPLSEILIGKGVIKQNPGYTF
ncbi:RagB/SusD family nutrient uptake outer membrane protein [Pedobacter deserti]|uniref:RagB/SusD family nutrient uptake outer membrane protein n=1 Tax=Pedobacter deserti TaxID=2817382 RepID=UPI00210BCD32|nr:RagB/SusD family nutrient uptake outer membrane protein [Pedobacter sp. SYSU D00382]